MVKIAAVYFSNTDFTGQLVKAALSEIEKSGANIIQYQIEGKDIIEGRFIDDRLFDLATARHLGRRVVELAEK